MAALDKYKVILVAQIDGVSVANVFYVDVIDDAGTVDTPASISTHFQADIVALIAAQQTGDLVYECLLIAKVAPMSEPAVVFTFTLSGSKPGQALPTNVVLCANHISNDGRPRYRGRWFFAGLEEVVVVDGRWTLAVRTEWEVFLLAITNSFGITGESYILNHYSPFLKAYDPILRGRLSPQPRKLRSRTPGICSIS